MNSIQHIRLLTGDCRTLLKTLQDQSVQACVTSPPYWGLRDYGHDDQIGLEETPQAYVETMRQVFSEVWRVLRDDGTVWLNLGDSYAGGGNYRGIHSEDTLSAKQRSNGGARGVSQLLGSVGKQYGCKSKDLIGIPWRVALALQDDGWYLRSEITWCKRAPMPESVTDRPSSATEKIFLLTKSDKYFYDYSAVRNPLSETFLNDSRWKTGPTDENEKNGYMEAGAQNPKKLHRMFLRERLEGSNLKNYWLLSPEPCSEAHFATFPTEIPKRCIMLGSKPGDVVLDPFGGSGTTGMVALELGRKAVLIELNPDYAQLCMERCNTTLGLPL